MENDNQKPAQAKARLPEVPAMHLTTTLNGAGNGMMVGSLPFLAYDMYAMAVGKKVPKEVGMAGLCMSGVGIAVGAVFGAREARLLQEYRDGINNKLHDLENRLNASEEKVKSWEEKHQERHEKHPHHEGHER